jgi:hypothetical protein
MRFNNLKFNFSEFQQLRNKYAQYTLCGVFRIVTGWEFDSQQFQQISIKFSLSFLTRPFVNYFVSIVCVAGKAYK